MGKVRGKDVTKNESGCLGCHAVRLPEKTNAELVDKTFDIKEGVSCVVCHGAHAEWVDLHGSSLQNKREKWRGVTREAKEKKWGMIDLSDPAKRTRMCVSCHIRNTEEGEVVTPALYAAGHTPFRPV